MRPTWLEPPAGNRAENQIWEIRRHARLEQSAKRSGSAGRAGNGPDGAPQTDHPEREKVTAATGWNQTGNRDQGW